jgi:hypothetical protein
MKKISLVTIGLMFSLLTFASQLVLIPTNSPGQLKDAFGRKDISINFYNDNFIIATTGSQITGDNVILDRNAWSDKGTYYFLLNTNSMEKQSYLEAISGDATVLYEGDDFFVVSANEKQAAKLYPCVHGGMVRITNTTAVFPPKSINYKQGTLGPRDDIFSMIAQVNADTLEAFVQHLQDFGTRNAYKAGSLLAQDWILSKFESFGLSVELYDFSMPGGPASDNVIATITGTKYPDEYVVLGGHYDSYAGGNSEPGADDNATGAAGILEAARILSQYQFDRSIIFATWSGEEYGLYGSEAWVGEAAANGMNILGYFNIDMAGYLAPGQTIHTDIIAPSSADELKQFHKDVCAIYLPDFGVFNGSLSGGDSDHTSFNNAGYQGIFPFEDAQNYSPYIHTAGDSIGPSVNNFEQHATFVKAIVASVVSMSDELQAPANLSATVGDAVVALTWVGVDSAEYYNIYRNAGTEPYATATEVQYSDTGVENGTSYTYYVTAVFLNSGEESGPSNLVTVIPMPPISLPFFDDFETGGPYWTFSDTWGLQEGTYHSASTSLTESPSGDYQANMDSPCTLSALNFTGASTAQISFWTTYSIESDYDYMYLEVSTDGLNWDQLASYTGSQATWTQETYSLDDYVEKATVIIRFRFTSDGYVEEEGMYIDDLEVTVSGVGIKDEPGIIGKQDLQFHPNPAGSSAMVEFYLDKPGMTKIYLTDAKGRMVKTLIQKDMETGSYQEMLDVSTLQSGVYYGILEENGRQISRKLVISR